MTRVVELANGIYRRAKYLLFTITPARALLLIATRNGERSVVVVVDCPIFRSGAERWAIEDEFHVAGLLPMIISKFGINSFHYLFLRHYYLNYTIYEGK